MTFRVIQIGAGLTGRHALRTIARRTELQLVGLWVHSAEKAGLTPAAILGDGSPFPSTVTATRDFEDVIATPADCVLFMPADPTISSPADPGSHGAWLFELVCRFLASGKNVVSTALISLVNPQAAGAGLAERLAEACEAGGSSFFATGISPGFISDTLALTLSSLSQSFTRVNCAQLLDFGAYNDPRTLAAYGFGARPSGRAEDSYGASRDRYVRGYGPALRLTGTALGLQLGALEFATEVATTPFDVDYPGGSIQAGCIAAHRSWISGAAPGGQRVEFERIVRMHADVAPDWTRLPPSRQWSTRVRIDGTPAIDCALSLGSGELDGVTEACIATAARAVNAVPSLCAAPPGVKTLLDMPLVRASAH